MFLVSHLKHLVSPVLPVCLHLPSLAVAQSMARFRTQLGCFLEKKKKVFYSKLQCKQGFADFISAEPYFWPPRPCLHCPNTVEFSLWGELCCWLIAWTQNRFMFRKNPKPNLFLSSFFLPLLSSIEFGTPTEYLLSAGTGWGPQTTQELALNCAVQIQLSI